MVYMTKENLKLLTLLLINSMDENSKRYRQCCDIILTLLGVSDANGNLTPEYKDSGMWVGGDDGTPLRPSNDAIARADLRAKLPSNLRHRI